MERAQNLKNPFRAYPATHRISIIVIVLFHMVGLAGFIIPDLNLLFLSLVPWHLLLMAAVIIFACNVPGSNFLWFALLVFAMGFAAEYIGVHTGWLFGSYTYGETLGIKLFHIPLMIGVNWFLLIYSTGVFVQQNQIKNMLLRIVAGATIMVMLDILIEPVATSFDYWHWAGDSIPVKNYVSWFILSALMLFIFEKFKLRSQSRVAPTLLIMQFVFFMVLGILG